MVQLKYFGDSRDFFKYDLITSVIDSLTISSYCFVPMLTLHRVDAEGNITPKMIVGKSDSLLSFIDGCKTKDLNHWEKYFIGKVDVYKTIKPVNETYFDDTSRGEYWKSFTELLQEQNALIFIDPDTGLETGKPSYLRRKGREKYIFNDEIRYIHRNLDPSSILMIYQHLPKDKHVHEISVLKKLLQLKTETNNELVCAYREDDLAFLFNTKRKELFDQLISALESYHVRSGHEYKSIHTRR